MEAVDSLPTEKKIDELEAKNDFLLEKANKLRAELKETKEDHYKAIDKLNITLTFNQKFEAYVSHPGDVVNKARLFDANLAKNPVLAGKVILILVDFVEKMEELLDKMRTLFDGLQVEVPLVAAENLLDISGEIPSLTEWGQETEMLTKLDQPGPFEPTREEEVPTGPEYTSSPRRQVAEPTAAHREVPVNTIVEEVVRELEGERSQAHRVEAPPQPARIDTIQTGPDEPATERMRKLLTPPTSSIPEPITFFTPRPLVRPSFISELERITRSPFKTPGIVPTVRLPVFTPTPESTGPDTRDELEASGSGRATEGGTEATETSSLVAWVTRSAAKQTPGPTSSLPKRPFFFPTKGSSSKRSKK